MAKVNLRFSSKKSTNLYLLLFLSSLMMMVKQMSRKTPSVRVCCRHLFSWPFALNPQIAKLHLFAFHELTIPKNPWHTSGALSTWTTYI